MSAHVVIELDTTPPVATWGEPDGAAGTALRLPYTLDEPAALSAELTDLAGQVFELDVGPDGLEGSLLTAVPGLARVDLLVRDDVWNETVRSLSFQLQAGPTVEGPTELRLDSTLAELGLDVTTAVLRVDPTTGELLIDSTRADVEVDDDD